MRTNGISRLEGTIIALAVTGTAATGHAGLVSWDGGGDGSTWQDSMNWTGNSLPAAADDVVIAAGEVVSLSSFTTETVSSIACDGSLVLASGTLVVDGASVVNELTISNGTWDGAGDLTINGLFTWTSGAMRGSGTTFANGGMDMSSGGTKSLYRDMENGGTAAWSGGQLRISDPATFVNLPGAVFDHQADNLFWWDSTGPGTFDNRGTFRKSAGTGNTDVRVLVDSSGNVDVQTSTILFRADSVHSGSMSGPGEVEFSSGTHVIEASADVTCALECSAGSMSILGAVDVPSLTISSSGNVDVGAASIDVASYVQSNGTLTGSGDVVVSGLASWSAGTISGTGTFFANGGMDLPSGGTKLLRRDLENAGAATWSGGQLRISDPATFVNLPGAVFDHQADNLIWWDTGGPGTFDNRGTFRKSAGTGLTDVRVLFDSSGDVDVQTSTILFRADSVHSGSMSGPGEVEFSSGTHVIEAAADVTCALECSAGSTSILGAVDVPSLTISSSGNVDVGAASIDVASYVQSNGTLTGSGDVVVSGLASWSAGTISGTGTFFANGGMDLPSGGTKLLRRDLENAGAATWSGGQLRISDPATFVNLPGAVFDHQADNLIWWDTGGPGTFDNRGTFRKSAGTGATDIRVIFANAGTFETLAGKTIIGEGYTQTAGATRVDTELEFALGNQMDLLGGIACGNGLIDGFVNNDGGTINPGLSPGTLNVEGDVDQSFFGALVVELGGPGAGEHDVLAVDGDAMLGGLLDIRRFEGYQPPVGQVFTILTTTGSRIDTFDETACEDFFEIRYLDQAVELEVIAELPIADITQDCSVGFADLSMLLGSWGPCPPDAFCAPDFDGSGHVGFSDLSFLLGSWG